MWNSLPERVKVFIKLAVFLAVFVILIFLLVYFFFLRTPTVPTLAPEPSPSSDGQGGLPKAGVGTPGSGNGSLETGTGNLPPASIASGGLTLVTALTQGAVISPAINTSGTVTYYDPGDGRFYSIDAQGNVVKLSEAQFPEAQRITFSPHAEEAVIEFPDGSNIVYMFSTAQNITLPRHWEEFSFSADGTQIAAKSSGSDPNNQALVITSTDGSTTSVVRNLGSGSDNVDVNWSPEGRIIAFSRTGGGTSLFGQNLVYLMDTSGEAAGVLAVNGTNLIVTWAPDGKYLLYSVADATNDYRASLWYNDARGDREGHTRLQLNIQTTADKCIFASTTLAYCAVPETMPAGGGADPLLLTGPDALYSIVFPSGKVTRVAVPDTAAQMFNLQLSPDGSTLYFTDSQGALARLRLK